MKQMKRTVNTFTAHWLPLVFLKLHFIGCQDDIPLKSLDNTYDAYNKYIPKCQSCAGCHEKKNLIKKKYIPFFL